MEFTSDSRRQIAGSLSVKDGPIQRNICRIAIQRRFSGDAVMPLEIPQRLRGFDAVASREYRIKLFFNHGVGSSQFGGIVSLGRSER